MVLSGGSRISRWGGRRPVGGGTNLRRVHFLAKTYAKTKEIDPVGGGGAHAGSAPPGSANGTSIMPQLATLHVNFRLAFELIP